MTEVTQHTDAGQDKQSYELENLRRELWMRVLGIKMAGPRQSATQTESVNAASTHPASSGSNRLIHG